jgi:hypothetical protein
MKWFVPLLAGPLAILPACSDYSESEPEMSSGSDQAQPETFPGDSPGTVERFKARDPSLKKFFDTSYAYVVFPKISKGAAGVGAANGEGDVYRQGNHAGTAEVTQVTLGAQLGGQTFSEVIFFQDESHFNVFKDGNLEFAANASAIAAESGAGASNDFSEGIAVFTMPRAGLMFEAAIGGQKFTYRPNAK